MFNLQCSWEQDTCKGHRTLLPRYPFKGELVAGSAVSKEPSLATSFFWDCFSWRDSPHQGQDLGGVAHSQ